MCAGHAGRRTICHMPAAHAAAQVLLREKLALGSNQRAPRGWFLCPCCVSVWGGWLQAAEWRMALHCPHS